MNPCPCGYYGDPTKECTCAPSMVTRYQKRISGPLLDRIDIHIEVPRVPYEKLTSERLGESFLTSQRGCRRRVTGSSSALPVRTATSCVMRT
jgi:magnesium chelatase family protein